MRFAVVLSGLFLRVLQLFRRGACQTFKYSCGKFCFQGVVLKELNFLDLAVLEKIDGESVVERFGPKINSSLFGAANVLGTLKIKGYVDIQTSLGFTPVSLTEEGKRVLAMADEKSAGEMDALDMAVMSHAGLGFKEPEKLEQQLNIRSGDLAFRLYKLSKLGMIDYVIKSGTGASPSPRIEVMLTEQGYAKTDQAKGYTKALVQAREEEEREPSPAPAGDENIASELVSDEPATMGEKLPKKINASPEEMLEPPTPVIVNPSEEERLAAGELKKKEVVKALPAVVAVPEKVSDGPVKIDATMKMKARVQYYAGKYGKLAVLLVVVAAIAVAYFALKPQF